VAKGEDSDDHHFVPQFYLRPWLDRNDRKLVEYGRVPPTMEIRCRRWVTSRTAQVPNLYTLPGVTEDTKQNVETVFNQEVDTSASKIRDKLLLCDPLSDEDRWYWGRFLLWLGMRNPTEIQKFKDRMKRDFAKPDARLEAMYAKIWKEGMPPTVKEALLQMNSEMPELAALVVATRLAQNKNVLKTMIDLDWMVYDANTSGRRFLTCDRPLIMTSGLGGKNGHIAIPISPDKLFVIASPLFNDSLSIQLPDIVVNGVNQVIIAQAREKVYGVDNSYLAEVRAGMSSGDYFSLAVEPTRQ